MAAEYLVRFDDICPTMPWKIWGQIEAALDQYKVKPLLNRVEKFFPFYHRELKKNDLPIEYAAISLIESILIPDIVSKAKAVGLWQFIPTTAEHFKIFKCEKWKISRGGRWYCPKVLFDHRDNIIASTGAALRFIQSHLQKIKTKKIPANLQGLALLTSYNGGFGKVEKMLKTCAPQNLFVNCEIESLPQETQII